VTPDFAPRALPPPLRDTMPLGPMRGAQGGAHAPGRGPHLPPPSLLLPLPVSLLYIPSLRPSPPLPTVAPTRVPTVHSLPLPPRSPRCARISPLLPTVPHTRSLTPPGVAAPRTAFNNFQQVNNFQQLSTSQLEMKSPSKRPSRRRGRGGGSGGAARATSSSVSSGRRFSPWAARLRSVRLVRKEGRDVSS